MKNKILIASLCLVAVVASGVLGYHVGTKNMETPAVVERVDSGSIRVPGYDYMSMKEGDTSIPVTLYNPKENNCRIVAAIILPDGTEVYRSDPLGPGDTLNKINISKPLGAGTYNRSILRYYCYGLNDMRQINEADVIFTLEVKP